MNSSYDSARNRASVGINGMGGMSGSMSGGWGM